MATRVQHCRVLFVDADGRLGNDVRDVFAGTGIEAAPQGTDFESGASAVRSYRPDVVVVDLSSRDAFSAIEEIMADAPTPILGLRRPDVSEMGGFEALGLGALEIADCPMTPSRGFWLDLLKKILLLAQVRVVRHVRGAKRRRKEEPRADAASEPAFPLVAIASSLGGPKALSQLLRMVPRGFGAPICVCQHISPGFTVGLAQWLATETALRVQQANDGDALAPGTVFIAPSGTHLVVLEDGRLKLDERPPQAGFKPSCDLLLSSAAQAFGRRCIGVVLTGMGRDGARGLKEVRERGGRTVVQDEATCVVYGMPGAAVELGAAEQILPLDEIAPALIKLVDQC